MQKNEKVIHIINILAAFITDLASFFNLYNTSVTLFALRGTFDKRTINALKPG